LLVSGEVAEDPVVTRNGDVFERRLVEKYIAANGVDPVTKTPLTKEELISIKVKQGATSAPRSTTNGTSIPQLLTTFQNEWDALVLSVFSLKQQLLTTRQELSQALYQHDAALRVIARLTRERDEALDQIKKLSASGHVISGQASQSRGGDQMDVEPVSQHAGLSSEAKNKFAKKSQELSAERKSRKAPSTLASVEYIKSIKSVAHIPPHKTSVPGVTCLDVHGDHVVTGGADNTVVLLSNQMQRTGERISGVTSKKDGVLSGHSKRVNKVKFHPEWSAAQDLIVSCSQDSTVRVWRDQKEAHVISAHQGSITDIDLHCVGDHVLATSKDGHWSLSDLHTGQTLVLTSHGSGAGASQSGFSGCSFHPDGLIFATGGDDGVVRVWDVKSNKNVANFEGHKGYVTALTFNENGYFMATAAEEDQVIKLWDLRKPKNLTTLKLDAPATALSYDWSGVYLAVATGHELRVFTGKNFEHVHTMDEHTSLVTGVKWLTRDATALASTSMDRNLRFWA
jgi:pre-mRNA-processing factor 19